MNRGGFDQGLPATSILNAVSAMLGSRGNVELDGARGLECGVSSVRDSCDEPCCACRGGRGYGSKRVACQAACALHEPAKTHA